MKAPSCYFVTLTPKVFNSFQNAGKGSNIGHSLSLCGAATFLNVIFPGLMGADCPC